ncbi:MAG: hypothetical protein ABIT83_04265 [Massilia sp.]
MHKLISELTRLYLPAGALTPEAMERQLRGQDVAPTGLVDSRGMTRAIVIAFPKIPEREDEAHWSLLCEVANALQADLGFPAPAVSISGSDGFRLWLSLAAPIPVALANQLLALLNKTYFPAMPLQADAGAPVALPPCLDPRTEKWAAFINPGLGASFAADAGLEMPPPLAGQIALLDSLHSIGEAQLQKALNILAGQNQSASPPEPPSPVGAKPADGLLLKDATLEDIVRHLHAKNIEPTFRHRLPR